MLIVIGKAKLADGAIDTARAAFTAMIEASRAEEGCIDYGYAFDLIDPTVMHITEKWADEAALMTHIQMPHMAAFQKALGEFDVKIIEVKKFQADDGAPLM